ASAPYREIFRLRPSLLGLSPRTRKSPKPPGRFCVFFLHPMLQWCTKNEECSRVVEQICGGIYHAARVVISNAAREIFFCPNATVEGLRIALKNATRSEPRRLRKAAGPI